MSKFWDNFDKMFENMDEMFKHLDSEIKSQSKIKKITKVITKKIVDGEDGEVNIFLSGSSEMINNLTDKITEIIDKYNKNIESR